MHKFYTIRFFMMFISVILGISMLVCAAFSTMFICLNRIVTLVSNQGGAILKFQKIAK